MLTGYSFLQFLKLAYLLQKEPDFYHETLICNAFSVKITQFLTII